MKRDDILRMAREAGLLDKVDCSNDYFIPSDALFEEIECFATLVAKAEREACAEACEKIAEEFAFEPRSPSPFDCAAAIRARGENK